MVRNSVNSVVAAGKGLRTSLRAQPVIMPITREIRIGHSPDPDDAFMFHALTNGTIETPGIRYVHELQDIETLNQRALRGELEVSAVSIHAFPEISDSYSLMNCGASMGEGYGPIIVSKKGVGIDQARKSTIAIPGLKTSAFLGLKLAWGDVSVEVVAFDEIIPKILADEYLSGVIIHEGQLTYSDYGLEVLLDLGLWWSEKTNGLPMPLGGNVVRKDLGEILMERITRDTKRSIEYSLNNPSEALAFAKKWGRGIDDDTNEEFVQMYVNKRTIDYGEEGRESIRLFLKEGQKIGMVEPTFDVESIEFIGE